MVADDEKEQIRLCLDALRRGVDGFRSRRPQLEMIAVAANTLAECKEEGSGGGTGRHIAVIEAGTGTGKTFGALVPALVMARSRGKRLVVSSSTVSLQEQYFNKDAPLLREHLPIHFTYAVAKGRRRYVCAAKLAAAADEARQQALDIAEEQKPPQPSPQEQRKQVVVVELAQRLEAGSWNGDRDELKMPVLDAVWTDLTTDRQGCSGNRCPQFAQCPFYAARQKVKEATVVFANHDLVLASLEMESGSVLPAPSETFYVFDEAHSMPSKVIEHFSAKHAIKGAKEWVHGAGDAVLDVVLGLRLDQQLLRDARSSAERLGFALGELYARVHATRAFEEKRARRFKDGALPDWLRALGETIQSSAQSLQKTFAALREQMLERASTEGHLVTTLLGQTGFYTGKLENLIDTWDLLLADEADGDVPVARWIERHEEGSNSNDYLVCASPISGSDKLRKLLWNRASAVVLMSATLTSCGSFNLFLNQTGLGFFRDLQMLQVASPFDYRRNARLIIPAMRADPADARSHTDEVIARMPDLVTTRGTLVLFASGRQMRDVFAQMPEDLRRITLMQGTLPKAEMLARHKAAIDRGGRSMLFGLASLAEGVDLPREYCTHVICPKLPFAVPDSPLEEARREWVEKQGRSAFIEITIPETAMRLKQALGRLLRTDADYGTATILDRRIVSKRWGSLLMRGLPDFEVVVERPDRSCRP